MKSQRLPARRMVGDVDIDRQVQLRAFFPEWIQPNIVQVQPLAARQMMIAISSESPALVRKFADTASTFLVTANEFTYNAFRVILGLRTSGIQSAVQLKTVG